MKTPPWPQLPERGEPVTPLGAVRLHLAIPQSVLLGRKMCLGDFFDPTVASKGCSVCTAGVSRSGKVHICRPFLTLDATNPPPVHFVFLMFSPAAPRPVFLCNALALLCLISSALGNSFNLL